jgi:hypothetical protein
MKLGEEEMENPAAKQNLYQLSAEEKSGWRKHRDDGKAKTAASRKWRGGSNGA